MDLALDVLNRGLRGDHAALAFLDRTSSIYVLDATDPAKPKTYGGWNFIHQAMNEIERREALYNANTNNSTTNTTTTTTTSANPASQLCGHSRLLLTLAERVARRSPAVDKSLISTCIANASQYQGGSKEAQALIDLNSQIREIVMGRIATMAFDFSLHNNASTKTKSVFADPVVMEKLCSVLSANAVSSGPAAVAHFMREWIIPSCRSLPPLAVACVVYHLGIEALTKNAPSGTRDILQQLSAPVVGRVLAPILIEAVQETETESEQSNPHTLNCRIAAISIRALERWCTVTELSLPQIKHICTKAQVEIVPAISDALYSDSDLVVESMAEFLDVCLAINTESKISVLRTTQARYIMEVDEQAFQSISPEDLYRIEVRETQDVLAELVSAVGLQRFRFAERQSKGDHAVCQNLARIAAVVGKASLQGLVSGEIQAGSAGLLDLLMKGASSPYVHTCAIAIDILVELLPVDPNFPPRMLPLLQHRAIIPYWLVGTVPTLNTETSCGVNFSEFVNFRDSVLSAALLACFQQNPTYYLESCTSAVEEFCTAEATVEVSFQLEAALFCMNAVTSNVMATDSDSNNSSNDHDKHLLRCVNSLAKKPSCLAANPLALGQLNRYLASYSAWFGKEGSGQALGVATELALSTVKMSCTAFSGEEPAKHMLKEMIVSPFSEACRAVHMLLSKNPSNFISPQDIANLGATWHASYTSANRGSLNVEDREELCSGMCLVVSALPSSAREKPYFAFCVPTIECIKNMTKVADEQHSNQDNTQSQLALRRVGDEIKILSTLVRAYGRHPTGSNDSADHGSISSKSPLLILKEVWPCLTHLVDHYSSFSAISQSVGCLLIRCIPTDLEPESSLPLLKELCDLIGVMMVKSNGATEAMVVIFDFIRDLASAHGRQIELAAQTATETLITNSSSPEDTTTATPTAQELGRLLEKLILTAIQSKKHSLGIAWARDKEQGQGQQPFESKVEPMPEQASCTEVLSSIFVVLRTFAYKCPTFLVFLPASLKVDGEYDRLLERAVESALASIVDLDVEVSRQAILFLKALVEMIASIESANTRSIAERIISRVCGSIISVLFGGICGSLHPSLLDPAAALFHVTAKNMSNEEVQRTIAGLLSQENFRIGNRGREATASFLNRCASSQIPLEGLVNFTEELWALHQASEVRTVGDSDHMVGFVHRYG